MEYYIIRKLNENDYVEYLKLINQFRPTEFSKEDFINTLCKISENSDIWIMLKKENNIIHDEFIATGTILYEHKFIHNISKLAHIEDICVNEKYRGQKCGHHLMKFLINEAIEKKCYKVTLYCNEDLEKFYSLNKFEKKGIQMAMYI